MNSFINGDCMEGMKNFEDNHFDRLVISAKSHDVQRCIAVNRAISEQFDYPLHLGLTHAGDTLRAACAPPPH